MLLSRDRSPVLVLLGAGLLISLLSAGAVPAETPSRYKPEECARCHGAEVLDLATAGGNHKNIPCGDCHAGHPPDVANPIAPCGKCHSTARNDHFKVPGCLNCHQNAHKPMQIALKGAGKDACLVCHGLESWELRKYPSKHSALDCSVCHDIHRKFPSCFQCHKPHKGKIAGGCDLCHKAHMPKLAGYPEAAPSQNCGMCHKIVADILRASKTKHSALSCRICHQKSHRMKPSCRDCHGSPHPKDMMERFSQCGECHNVAHDLNWSSESRETT